jgi:hypothetical protein
MSNVTEFVAGEVCTATIHMPLETGESYQGPVHIGHHGDSKEVFISCEGHIINIPEGYLEQVIKQLRRAYKIAASKDESHAN